MNQPCPELEAFLADNSMGPKEFGDWLGVSSSCVQAWRAKGEIPAYAARSIKLAGEVKEARSLHREAVEEAKKPSDVRAVVVKGKAGDIEALLGLALRLNLETLDLDL
jgi:hypothetical protein